MNKYLLVLISILFFTCKKEDTPPIIPPAPLDARVKIIQDEIDNTPIVVAGSAKLNFVVSFERTLSDGTVLDFPTALQDLPNIMQDQEGTQWDIFGVAIDGPRTGQQLVPLNSYMGFWFAWATMYPGIEIYNESTSPEEYQRPPATPNWTIPTTNVYVGAGVDAIPAIDDPTFLQYRGRNYLDEAFYVKDEDLVIGVKVGTVYRLYPIPLLNWHEIVNDEIDGC